MLLQKLILGDEIVENMSRNNGSIKSAIKFDWHCK